MDSGRILWSRQFTENDSWNFACGAQDKTNCPTLPFIDHDLGNSGILRSIGGGKRILVAGDKSGMIFGIDPDREGAVIWHQKIAMGGINGGTMWGAASDDQGVAYIGISDFTPGKPEVGGGLIAMQLATGKQLWMTNATKPA
jgi:polyvinyl alcohol dehydrogenase (cytochrome)